MAEIENRALDVQGIYHVSRSRVRVEWLCQVFENGWALVELLGNSPHDVSGVLKRFLQELTNPVVPFHLYDAFISLAKTLHADPGTANPNPEVIRSLKMLLAQLSNSNYNTLRHLVAHLFRVAAAFEENKMSANNLGIIFGPTLMRPLDHHKATSASSATCLLDSGHQTQLIEFLIANYEQIFGMDELPLVPKPLPQDPSPVPEPLTTNSQPPPLATDTWLLAGALDPNPKTKPQSTLEEYPKAITPESDSREEEEETEDTGGAITAEGDHAAALQAGQRAGGQDRWHSCGPSSRRKPRSVFDYPKDPGLS